MDRNINSVAEGAVPMMSLSARRAWIEILIAAIILRLHSVALRKESVDRNTSKDNENAIGNMSLSARRAWIEIKLSTKSAPEC